MKQDLRRDARYPIELDVDLFSRGQRIGHFKTRDIGPSGLFIEIAPLRLRPGHPVDVAFSLPNCHIEVPGIVTHRTTAGMSIRFIVVSHALFDALNELLSIEEFSSALAGYRQF